ncbi:MAG: hypothetical protein ACREE4_08610, partial [Stellaceae bacterium]
MEAWAAVMILVIGAAIGAAIAWLFSRGAVTRLYADLQAAQSAEKKRFDELTEARQEGESWRGKFQAEQLERAHFETEAQRIAGIETELQQIRSRVETLASEKSALQIDADRIPALETRLCTLGGELSDLKAVNARLQTQSEEQARSHTENISALTEIRGEIEKDLKNITADALRSNQRVFLGLAKRQFSEFASELARNQEYASALEQGLDDEAEPVIAQSQPPVF